MIHAFITGFGQALINLVTCRRCERIQIISHRNKRGEYTCSCAGCGMRYDCLCWLVEHGTIGERERLGEELLKPWRNT